MERKYGALALVPMLGRRIAPATLVLAVGFGIAPQAHAGTSAPVGKTPAASQSPVPPGQKLTPAQLRKRLADLNAQLAALSTAQRQTAAQLARAGAARQRAVLAGLLAQQNAAQTQLNGLRATLSNANSTTIARLAIVPAELRQTTQQASDLTGRITSLTGQITTVTATQQNAVAQQGAGTRLAATQQGQRASLRRQIAGLKHKVAAGSSFSAGGVTIHGSGLAFNATKIALGALGKPYEWAAAGPDSFDCSGLVIWAYGKAGRPGMPHYTGDLYANYPHVDQNALKLGDMVFFGSDLHHMGIYLGGGKFLEAPSTGDVVKITPLSTRSDYAGAARVA